MMKLFCSKAILLGLGVVSAQADIYTYMCKVGHGRVSPVTANEEKNTLTWCGETYEHLTAIPECRAAWTAKRNGVDVTLCTMTQGGAELTIGKHNCDCHMPDNPTRQDYREWLKESNNATAQAARSEYTSLDAGCKVLWRAADQHPLPPLPDSFESICPGRDGMRVVLEGGDARSWITLVPSGVKYDQGTRLYFSKRLEWRYSGSKLVALIVRSEWTEDNKTVSGLVIWRLDTTKLDKTCAIGRTASNEEAQAIADDISQGCLEQD